MWYNAGAIVCDLRDKSSKTAYAIHMGSFWNSSTRDNYLGTGSALFENLLLNDVYTLALIRSPDGLWRTNFTSMWVKAESGIHAPYVDTHHNDAIA